MRDKILFEMAALTNARFVPENDYFASVRPKAKEPMFTFGSNGETGVSGDDPEHKYWQGTQHKPAETKPAPTHSTTPPAAHTAGPPPTAGSAPAGGDHKGEKMVFGVWRPVGRKLSSAEHQKVGSEYHKASQGHLKAAKDAAAAGEHEKAEHHFGEHVKTSSAAKVHYKGWKGQAHDDFYAHPSHRVKGADGTPEVKPHADPFAGKGAPPPKHKPPADGGHAPTA
jgi:hypothetical protein